MDKTETPASTVLPLTKLIEKKGNGGKEPAGIFNLVVSNLVQHFSSSDTDKDTKSKFFADGDNYVGEWLNGKRHGQGILTYANGDKYVGEWNDNKRNGQGTFERKSNLMDDIVQEGMWKDGVFQE